MNYHNYVSHCHPQWQEILYCALETMDHDYLEKLVNDLDWLPGKERLLAAFSLPLEKMRYILLGESPYPRKNSANGYAFWDNSVVNLWSAQGLSKAVNKATSLRNLIKMLLVARGSFTAEGQSPSQACIALLDKKSLVQTAEELFSGMITKGMLLLNASLVYSEGKVPYHARQWQSFLHSLMSQLATMNPNIQLIVFGKIAQKVSLDKLPVGLIAEHPYNVSFISNQQVINFFKPLDLLHHE